MQQNGKKFKIMGTNMGTFFNFALFKFQKVWQQLTSIIEVKMTQVT